MADLLSNLEVGLSHSTGTSDRLRSIIVGIDQYMQMQTQGQYRKASSGDALPHQQIVSGYNDGAYGVLQGQQHPLPETTEPAHLQDGSAQFELPMELLADWPWSSEFTQFTM